MMKAIKRLFSVSILTVIAFAALTVLAPAPTAVACLHCFMPDCGPCTQLTHGDCFHCPACVPIPGCKP